MGWAQKHRLGRVGRGTSYDLMNVYYFAVAAFRLREVGYQGNCIGIDIDIDIDGKGEEKEEGGQRD